MEMMNAQVRFGCMAVALGLLDIERFGEAMVRLGRGEGPTLRELLAELGWLDDSQLAAVDEALDGSAPGKILAGAPYEPMEELGSGAFGSILRARDRRIGRTVAVKVLHPRYQSRPDVVARFLLEAQLAGQLNHPNIVPVYGVEAIPGSGIGYTMKEVEGLSLDAILSQLRDDGAEAEEDYSLPRLVGYLRQVCQAVAYAHAQGVIHRDIKPHNVMIGAFGEVLLLDWGTAKVLDEDEVSSDSILDAQVLSSSSPSLATQEGKVRGTPAYMAPEQARADADAVGPLTDVYALGAMLYEILCLRPPFSGDAVPLVLDEVQNTDPLSPSARAVHRAVPSDLDELAMACLAKDPTARPASARELVALLDEFLDGTRRRREAEAALADAETALERFEELRAEADRTEQDARQTLRNTAPWAPVADKRDGWSLEHQARDLHRQSEGAFNLALACFQRAQGADPSNADARDGLADLYWQKFEEAEARGDEEVTEFFKTQVLLCDTGRYRRRLGGMATLSVQTDPPGAEAVLYRCEEQDQVMVPSLPRALDRTPTRSVRIAQGSYIVQLQLDGFAEVRLALFCNRPGTRRYRVRMRSLGEVGGDYVHVPSGRFLMGGDPRVPESWPRRPELVRDFAIARHPVTLSQYMAFLQHVAGEKGKAALARAPRVDPHGRRLVQWDDDRQGLVLVGRGGRETRFERWPVTSISFDDAVAYADWRSEVEGRVLRLPTEAEWEKAARGVDGRLYPWGDRFESTYCNCRTSREHAAGLQPVGSFPVDVSPYGVEDMAGGVMEWCGDDEHPQARRVRGGAWNRTGRECSVVGGFSLPPWMTGTAIGLRLVAPLLGTGRI
jgi:eukaryotic-like serine/threonine-protein kinase